MNPKFTLPMSKNPWLFKKVFTAKKEFMEYLLTVCINKPIKIIEILSSKEELDDASDGNVTLLAYVDQEKTFINVSLFDERLSIAMMECN